MIKITQPLRFRPLSSLSPATSAARPDHHFLSSCMKTLVQHGCWEAGAGKVKPESQQQLIARVVAETAGRVCLTSCLGSLFVIRGGQL